MTTEQKQLIHRLRAAGKDYQTVATEIGLNIGTVKTYCFSHGLSNADIENEQQKDTCPCCGAAITQRHKVKPRRFCSDKCRIKWWNENRGLQNKKVFTQGCARVAERSSFRMETKIENTVATPAMSIKGLVSKKQPMTAKQFESEKGYAISDRIFRMMLENGLITKSEYRKLNTIIAKKYDSISGSLLW